MVVEVKLGYSPIKTLSHFEFQKMILSRQDSSVRYNLKSSRLSDIAARMISLWMISTPRGQ